MGRHGQDKGVFLKGPKKPLSERVDEERKELIQGFEARREALGLTRRGFSVAAGLDPDYYPSLVRGRFRFPSIPKRDAIEKAFKRLEALKSFNNQLLDAEEAPSTEGDYNVQS